jgi:hypothetical protein
LHTGYAAAVLDNLGVTRDRVRESAGRLLEPSGDAKMRMVGAGEDESTMTHARQFAPSALNATSTHVTHCS